MSLLNDGGVLTIQMPRPFIAKFHDAMLETIRELGLGPILDDRIRKPTVQDPVHYLHLLEPHSAAVDVWQTEYIHPMLGEPHPVVLWTEATTLLPVKKHLPPQQYDAFLGAYTAKIAALYPLRADKTAIFDLKRVFIVARK